jgi:hypothetical protein
MNTQKNKTYRIAILGILSAFIIVQTFVPFLGNIPIPPLNPTIIHITVIVAAFVLSTKDGMLVGLVWGLARMVKLHTAGFPIGSAALDQSGHRSRSARHGRACGRTCFPCFPETQTGKSRDGHRCRFGILDQHSACIGIHRPFLWQ